jgi:hypothetical protein
MGGMVATSDGLEALHIQKIEKPREKVLQLVILRTSGKEVRRCPRDWRRTHGMKKVLKITSKLILSSLKCQIPGAGRAGNSILVSFHSVTNS